MIDENNEIQKLIFKKNNELVLSKNGQAKIGKWEYFPKANSLLIDRVSGQLLCTAAFIDQGVIILRQESHSIVFYIGVFLVAIGVLGRTFAAFFFQIGLPVFVLGVVLIILSKKKWQHKLLAIAASLMVITGFWTIWTALNTVEPEIFLIPNDYRGRVTLIYKKGCGTPLEKTKDGYSYAIPKEGILILDHKQTFGRINPTYYAVDQKGNRRRIPKMDVSDFKEPWTLEKTPNEPSRNKVGVFYWGRTGSVAQSSSDPNSLENQEHYTYQEFYISSYNDLHTRFDLNYENQFDSLIKVKLKGCN